MVPNPIMIPRRRHSAESQARGVHDRILGQSPWIFLSSVAGLLILLVTKLPWVRRWTLSGSAIETLLLVYGVSTNSQVFPEIPIWALLALLNLVYAVSSTSWLLYGIFTAACYPAILLTCLFQFKRVSDFTRKWLRKLLVELHFTKDTIAFFNLPALEIDTEVSGLFVVRGLSISISSLVIVASGLELGIKLSDDIELALYVDQVEVHFFRRITIGEVYGNLKGGKFEMTFGDLDRVDSDDDSVFQNDTPLLRAATGPLDSPRAPRPPIPSVVMGHSNIKDSSLRESLDTMTTLSPDDTEAEKQYRTMLQHIETTSHVYEARKQINDASDDAAFSPDNERDMRAAICAKLQEMPSVPHPPSRSIRVTTLQNLPPPYVRRFLHRLPFLLRLLLMPLSYFHPISISAITAAGSGKWLTELLQEKVFKHYASQSAQIKRLESKVSTWLASANFCAQLTDIAGMGQVPLSSNFDIVTYLRFGDIMAYRTVPESGSIEEVTRLGGADATFTIPSFLLPHHEHLLPPIPTPSDMEKLENQAHMLADGKPKAIQAENELEKMKEDEAEIVLSVHASLPACFDQSLLNFVAALVKATKIIELEKAGDESDTEELPATPTSPTESVESLGPPSRTDSGFKSFASGIRKNIKDGSTGESLKGFARDLHQSTKVGFGGMKKAVVGGIANDRWIAKIVGKIAAKLEEAQGDVGYSGGIPIHLAAYRPSGDLPSKLLP